MMTVSRVMHNAESVRPATRNRVLQAIQTLNYVPDLSARKMRAQGRKPSTLAVLAQDTATTPFSVDILLAIEQTASEFGWNSFLINIFSEDDAARAARQLLAHRPDGIIYTTMGLRHITLPESLYGEILYWRTVLRMTQRYPVISLMITLHNMNQHSICSRRAIVNRYASGYRKVRWQQGIVGRDLSRPGVMLDEIWLR